MPKTRRQTRAARLRNESQPLVSENFVKVGNERNEPYKFRNFEY